MTYLTDEEARGYRKALLDIAERINNSTSNGFRQHWDTDLLDQLIVLSDEYELGLDADDVRLE